MSPRKTAPTRGGSLITTCIPITLPVSDPPPASPPIFDCDVHHGTPNRDEWAAYLDEPYRSEVAEFGLRVLKSGIRHEDGGLRWDVQADKPEQVIEQLLDRYGHRYAILTGNYGCVAGNPDPEYAAAICKAYNDYTVDKWLAADERFLMGIKVPLQDPQLAAAEIDRLADHPQAACVAFWGGSERIPFGQRWYWPIYEACERHGLPIHVHPSTTTGLANHATSAAGNLTNYLQWHVALPQFYQAHLISLVLEGVFERFPGLRFAFVEGGFGWLPHVVWRMDKEYKALRQQAPRLKRLPSDYVRDHVRLTTQPIEEPDKPGQLEQLIDMMGGPEVLMYASDFPHFDFDPPEVLPKRLGEEALRKILHDNAAAFFDTPQAEGERSERLEHIAEPVA